MKIEDSGEGKLFRDSKLGNLVNSLVTAAAGAAVVWLGDIDWSTWPAWVGTLGVPAAGLVAGLVTSWRAKHTTSAATYR